MHPDELAHFEVGNIVRPLSLERFRDEVYERTYLYCPQAVSPEIVQKVFCLEAFDRLLTGRALERSWVEVIHANGRVECDSNSARPLTSCGLSRLIRAGASIRVLNLQNLVSEVAEVAGVLSHSLTEPVQTNLYFTPPRGSGLKTHFDDHDVWILQCWGQKQWRIFDRYHHAIPLPRRGSRFDTRVHQTEGTGECVTLRPGDMLYLPRGVVHSVRCEALGSLHLTFGLYGFTQEDLLLECIRAAGADQIALRRKVQFSPHREGTAVLSEVRRQLAGLLTEENVRRALAALIGAGIDRMYSPTPGVIAAAIRGIPSSADASIRLRRHLSYQLRKLPEGTLLITHQQRTWLDDQEAAWLEGLTKASSVRMGSLTSCAYKAQSFIERLHALGIIEVMGE